MKRHLILTAFAVLAIAIFGQNRQHGCVRTPKRYIDHKFVEAVYIPGVKIDVEGRTAPVVSGSDGSFDFPVSGKTFRIQKVSGNAKYSLLDNKILNAAQQFSSSQSFDILMTNFEEDLELQLAATRRERANFQRRTEELRAENERLRKNGQISEEQYQKRLNELYIRIEKEDQLIKDFIEEYLKWDFNDIDDYNRQFRIFSVDGEYERRDSLQRTRGDVLGDARQLISEGEAIANERDKAEKRLREIETADSLRQIAINAKAQECYNAFVIHRDFARLDSAAIYIETRAAMDTTNVEWQLDAGCFLNVNVADYTKALEYNQRALRQAILQFGENSDAVVSAYNAIGYAYLIQQELTSAKKLFDKASLIGQSLVDQRHLAVTHCYIGDFYINSINAKSALEHYFSALKILTNNSKLENDSEDIADVYNSISWAYHMLGNRELALEYNIKAADMSIRLLGEKNRIVATCYNNRGSILQALGDYQSAINFYLKSIELKTQLIAENHPDIATTYSNIATLFYNIGDYQQSLEFLEKAIQIDNTIFGQNNAITAARYKLVGINYLALGDFLTAQRYFNKTLTILLNLGEPSPQIAEAHIYNGNCFRKYGDYAEALNSYNSAVDILLNLDDNTLHYHTNLASTYQMIGEIYAHWHEVDKAIEYWNMALDLKLKISKADYEDVTKTYKQLGEAYSNLEIHDKAITAYTYSLEFLQAIQDTPNESTAQLYINIANEYGEIEDFKKAAEYYTNALDIIKSLEGDYSYQINYLFRIIAAIHYVHQPNRTEFNKLLPELVFTITVEDLPNSTATDIVGEYYLLELENWNQDSKLNVFEIAKGLDKSNIQLLLMRDSIIMQRNATKQNDELSYAKISFKYVGKEEKDRINQAYSEWKKANRK